MKPKKTQVKLFHQQYLKGKPQKDKFIYSQNKTCYGKTDWHVNRN